MALSTRSLCYTDGCVVTERLLMPMVMVMMMMMNMEAVMIRACDKMAMRRNRKYETTRLTRMIMNVLFLLLMTMTMLQLTRCNDREESLL